MTYHVHIQVTSEGAQRPCSKFITTIDDAAQLPIGDLLRTFRFLYRDNEPSVSIEFTPLPSV